jgi:creatinine amidohydrolase
MSIYHLEEMFPDQVRERLDTCPLLVLPFGTIEWHSHHLPLGLDGMVAQAVGERIAELSAGLLAPVSYWAAGGVPYPYTLKLSGNLIEPLLDGLFTQFAEMGFRVIVGFTGHFGLEQTLALKRSALRVMRQLPVTILPVTEYDMTTDVGYTGDHAGVGETSLLWMVHPELVRMDAVPAEAPLEGVLGIDPRGVASPEQGRALFELLTSRIAEAASRLLRETTSSQRTAFIEALAAAVALLEATAQQRQVYPKDRVPPVTTPAYIAFCQAMYAGEYQAARSHAERKLSNLSE